MLLRVGDSLDLSIGLSLRATEAVTVSAAPATLTEPTEVISAQRIREEWWTASRATGGTSSISPSSPPAPRSPQGPDGDELNISGQRGIFNNFIVDGADFNNPFFGEQRGGQRPAFTFNQDAIADLVVVNQGATAEFGRSAGAS